MMPQQQTLVTMVRDLLPDLRPATDAWQDVWLAGQLWRLVRNDLTDEKKASHATLESKLRDQLLALCVGGHLSPAKRAAAGRALAELNDPRDLTELVTIPAGKSWIGSERKGPVLDECPQHQIDLPQFRIGKYPVTVGWWREFVAAMDYACDARSVRGHGNHPAHDVSWHEARDFCQWLTTEWRAAGRIGAAEVVRLPNEVEWEKAARGDDRREWPWGSTVDEQLSYGNTSESGIGRTCAVGLFPDGASPYGCLDMSGNVWEWTISLGAMNIKKHILPDKELMFEADRFFNYPYDPHDGREDVTAPREFTRVLRGGSFGNSYKFARCAVRGGNWADSHYDNIGFRIVVS